MTLEETGNWDGNLMENVLEYKDVLSESESGNNLVTNLDDQFLDNHPEFAGYYRVYIFDKYMVDSQSPDSRCFVTNLLNPQTYETLFF